MKTLLYIVMIISLLAPQLPLDQLTTLFNGLEKTATEAALLPTVDALERYNEDYLTSADIIAKGAVTSDFSDEMRMLDHQLYLPLIMHNDNLPRLTLTSPRSAVQADEAFTINWEVSGQMPATSQMRAIYLNGSFTPPAGLTPACTDEILPTDDAPGVPSICTVTFDAAVTGSQTWQTAAGSYGPYALRMELFEGETIYAEAGNQWLQEARATLVAVDGGEVAWHDDSLSVSFPPGALTEDAEITIRQVNTADLPPSSLKGTAFELNAISTASRAEITTFAEEVTISLTYDDSRFTDLEDYIRLYYFDETEQSWKGIETSAVDPDTNTLTAAVNHFTVFNYSASDFKPASLPTLDSFQVSPFTGAASYSLPIEVPAGAGGLQPSLSLSYSSATADNASIETQASWVGFGWSLDLGSITRNTHGTLSDFTDDTFNVVVNNVSGMLLQTGEKTYVEIDGATFGRESYTLSEINFWTFDHYVRTATINGVIIDYWVARDTSGNTYSFGDRYPEEGNRPRAGFYYCSGGAKWAFSKWMLTTVRNSAGQELKYNYKESLHYNANTCGEGKRWYQLANYPTTITYPNNAYRISFVTVDKTAPNKRLDYLDAWYNNGATTYDTDYLDKIEIQFNLPDASGTGLSGNWQTVKTYDLIYAQDDNSSANIIFPNHNWRTWGASIWSQNLTLNRVITRYPSGDELPAVTFTYGDGMHLTAAENGQGGRVEYTYEPWYNLENDPKSVLGRGNTLCYSYHDAQGNTYWGLTGGWNSHCTGDGDWNKVFMPVVDSAYSWFRNGLVKPGSYYQASITAYPRGHGDPNDWFSLSLGNADAERTPDQIVYSDGSSQKTFSYILKLDANVETVWPGVRGTIYGSGQEYIQPYGWVNGINIHDISFMPLPTYYRVTAKTYIDLSGSTPPVTYALEYDSPAVNDRAHSAWVDATNNCQESGTPACYDKPYTSYRGNAAVTATDPSGKAVTSFFYQDDDQKGQSALSFTANYTFSETFNHTSALDPALWVQSEALDPATIDRVDGDPALKLTRNTQPPYGWIQMKNPQTPDGTSFFASFKVDPGSSASFAINSNFDETRYRRWELYDSGSDIVAISRGVNGAGTIQKTLVSGADYEQGIWYTVQFIADDVNGFVMRLWKTASPKEIYSATCDATVCQLGNRQFWMFFAQVDAGTAWLDDVRIGRVYAMTRTQSAVVKAVRNVVDGTQYTDFETHWGMSINWTQQIASESYSFEGNAAYQATRTEPIYDVDGSGKPVYGNLIKSTTRGWDGTQWVNRSETLTEFYPNPANNIVALPGRTRTFACPNGQCNSELATNLVSEKRFIYDDAIGYTIPPATGVLTRDRVTFDFTDRVAQTGALYKDIRYFYDAWGNQTETWVYPQASGESGGCCLGTPLISRTVFDELYHTYPVQMVQQVTSSPLVEYITTIDYDYAAGLPISETDPNGNVTLAQYDGLNRISAIAQPGDTLASPTMTFSYHDYAGAGAPFWTEATQSVDQSTGAALTYRKFYNGMGGMVQTQLLNADVAGFADGTQTVVSNTFYNTRGQAYKQSLPYNITTPVGYVQPDVTQPVSETVFDALGRAIQSIAPDGSLTETSFNIVNTQRVTLVKNPKGYVTQSYTDMWGQTVKVQPVTGPWTAYHYDVKGQLTSVDQVNADGVFATTSLTYDFGGRKLSMDDADMGLWTYAYDTLGNLVQQTDARGQVITMCYDTLNRLTGKAYNGSTCASPEISYTYGTTVGELGYRVGMVDLSGSTAWTYNTRGQVTAESKTITGMGTFSTQWAYNTAGMLTQMTYPGGNAGQAGETVYYGYNGQGAIESVASLTNTYLTHADYDAQGRLTEQVFSGEQLIKQYQYHPWAGGSAGSGGKLSQVLAGARGSLTLQNLGYTYDNNGNILTIADGTGSVQTSTFTYDELDRLTSAQAVGGGLGEYPLETYAYDSLGRLWHKAGLEMSYNDAEHIHAVTSTSTGSNFVYDAAGNMTTRDEQTLTYTPEGKVQSVTIGTRTTGYGFDGDGNRVRKSEPAEPRYPFYDLVWKRTITIGNYYEFSVVEGLDTYDEITGINYYYAGSQRIAMKSNILGIEPAEVSFLLGDHLGSTSLVVDASGTLITEQRYKPFGESRYRATSGFPTDFQFTGQRWEQSTGLYDYVARMYDPITGHFISADTVFDGWDRYAYVLNNPLRFSDPSGHLTEEEIIAYVCENNLEMAKLMKENQTSLWEFLRAMKFGDTVWGTSYYLDENGVLTRTLTNWGEVSLRKGRLVFSTEDEDYSIFEFMASGQLAGLERRYGDKKTMVYAQELGGIYNDSGNFFDGMKEETTYIGEPPIKEKLEPYVSGIRNMISLMSPQGALLDVLWDFIEAFGLDEVSMCTTSKPPELTQYDRITHTTMFSNSNTNIFDNWVQTTVVRGGMIIYNVWQPYPEYSQCNALLQ